MNIDFDMTSRTARASAPAAGNLVPGQGGDARCDWHGLHARLAAAYAARPVLEGVEPRGIAIDGGSFDRGSAQALAVLGQGQGRELDRINPIGLANGNAGQDNHATVADACTAGD